MTMLFGLKGGGFTYGADPLPAITSDRWRVFVTSVGSNGAASIAEIEMRASVGGADQCSGGTASESSAWSQLYTGVKCFDDSISTLWASAGGDTAAGGSWVEYNFAVAVEVAEVAITARSGWYADQAPRDFSIQYFDGVAWSSVLTVTSEPAWSSSEMRTYAV